MEKESSHSTGIEYRGVLRRTLDERINRDPTYTLRQFATDLGLTPSRLSEILHGKDGLSVRKAKEVAAQLELTPWETERFLAMVEVASARSAVARVAAQVKLDGLMEAEKHRHIHDDCLAALGDWRHFALIELTRIKGFRCDDTWIGRRLGMSTAAVTGAVARLKRMGLLTEKRGRLVATNQRFTMSSEVPSRSIRAYHHAVLRSAMDALEGQTNEQREFSASLFPVDTKRLPALKSDLREMRRKLVKAHEDTSASDEVYCLAMQLFRVTKEETRDV